MHDLSNRLDSTLPPYGLHGVDRLLYREPWKAFYIYLPLQALLREIMG